MARLEAGIDYVAELAKIRDYYVTATPRQRLSIIRQRLEDHHFGPNRLVTAVSAAEALARSLAMHHRARTKGELQKLYAAYRDRSPKTLINEYLTDKGISDAGAFFEEDNWRLFSYAVEYRNLLAHECTYLGLDKFPSLIEACEAIVSKLAMLGGVRERRI
jgi:hypothetical protein